MSSCQNSSTIDTSFLHVSSYEVKNRSLEKPLHAQNLSELCAADPSPVSCMEAENLVYLCVALE